MKKFVTQRCSKCGLERCYVPSENEFKLVAINDALPEEKCIVTAESQDEIFGKMGPEYCQRKG
jgi:hypothetical protein